jgi:lipoate-protein ligase A
MLSLHFLGSRDAHTNLAYEQELFNCLRARPRPAMLFYVNSPCIVLGRSNREGEWVNMQRAGEAGVPVIRRFTGGGTVYHNEHVFNYSFILPKNIVDTLCGCGPEKPAGPQRYIDFFRGIIVAALSASGGGFSNGGISDILLGGRKISGNAQRIAKEVVLHHGTIMQRCPLEAIERLLPVPPNRPGVAHRGFVTGLAEEGRPLSQAWLATALAGRLRAVLGTRQAELPS